MATNRNFQFEGMTQIKRKLTNAGFTLIPLRHLMNEHAEVSVEKNGVAKDVYAGQFQKEDKEIYTINFYKQFHTDRSTSVALNLDKEQLEQIVEQAQKLLAE